MNSTSVLFLIWFRLPNDLVQTAKLITGIEIPCQAIAPNLDTASQLRLNCVRILKNSKPPKSNIMNEERAALHDLKADSILILPADKGRATVVSTQ